MNRIIAIFLVLMLCVCYSIPFVSAAELPETTEPTTSTDSEHGGGGSSFDDTTEEDRSWIENLLRAVFYPIISFFEGNIKLAEKFGEFGQVIADLFSILKEKLGLGTEDDVNLFQPIVDFVNRISNSVIDLLMPFWDFPAIGDLLMVAIVILLFGAIVGFATKG